MVVVTVLPFSPSVRSSDVPKSFSTSLTYSTSGSIGVSTTLSLAPTLTTFGTISVLLTTGIPSVTVPLVSLTSFGVVVTTLPSAPLLVTVLVPTSLVLSASYRVVTRIILVTTLDLAPFRLNTSCFSVGVREPVLAFTS